MPTFVCLYNYFQIGIKLEVSKIIVICYISAIFTFIVEVTLSLCDPLSAQKEILSEETEIGYGYDNHGEWAVLLYVVVNKLWFSKVVPFCVFPHVMPQTLANLWPS